MITRTGLSRAVLLAIGCCTLVAGAQSRERAAPDGPNTEFSALVGAPTDRSAVISVLTAQKTEARIEFGSSAVALDRKTEVLALAAGVPKDFELSGLRPNAECYYRVSVREQGDATAWRSLPVEHFHTRRTGADRFTFTVQGDSHPERIGKMFDPELYTRALANVAADAPDFHFLMGDDFSTERLFERGPKTQDAVNAIYANQRTYLATVGKRTALMLVNGNHEQAAKYLLDATANNMAVFAGKARTAYFPLPAPAGIYSGNTTPVEHIGLLRDYYAWEWGDALFVVIDPYWHSDAAVDNHAGEKAPAKDDATGGRSGRRVRDGQGDTPATNGATNSATAQPETAPAGGRGGKGGMGGGKGGGKASDGSGPAAGGGRGQRDLWQITLGDEQYQWLRTTLTQSDAKFKFVFSHHVLGTGRGGIEQAGLYEWGGNDRRGIDRFKEMRPKWQQPIHDLMRDSGVTIFFQGHDHLYARQELDGVIYQSCPNPADPTFTAFNREAYKSGDIFPNSGHLRITVNGGNDASCKVEYVRALRPTDEKDGLKNASIVHEYTARPRDKSSAAVSGTSTTTRTTP